MEGGHDVPIAKVISRYYKSILNCKRVATIADRVYVYDNSVDDAEARLLFRMTDGQLFKQYTNDIPEWATMILHSELPNENNEENYRDARTGRKKAGIKKNEASSPAFRIFNAPNDTE